MKEPLVYRLHPKYLHEIIGQQHLISSRCVLQKCIEKKKLFSMILYGPPGAGKTTLAGVLANEINMRYR